MKLSKFIDINNLAINLIESKQIFYSPIYSLGSIEFKTLKTDIKTWPIDLSDFLSHRLEIYLIFSQEKIETFGFNAYCL